MWWLGIWNENNDKIYVFDLPFATEKSATDAWMNMARAVEAKEGFAVRATTLGDAKKVALAERSKEAHGYGLPAPTFMKRLTIRKR